MYANNCLFGITYVSATDPTIKIIKIGATTLRHADGMTGNDLREAMRELVESRRATFEPPGFYFDSRQFCVHLGSHTTLQVKRQLSAALYQNLFTPGYHELEHTMDYYTWNNSVRKLMDRVFTRNDVDIHVEQFYICQCTMCNKYIDFEDETMGTTGEDVIECANSSTCGFFCRASCIEYYLLQHPHVGTNVNHASWLCNECV